MKSADGGERHHHHHHHDHQPPIPEHKPEPPMHHSAPPVIANPRSDASATRPGSRHRGNSPGSPSWRHLAHYRRRGHCPCHECRSSEQVRWCEIGFRASPAVLDPTVSLVAPWSACCGCRNCVCAREPTRTRSERILGWPNFRSSGVGDGAGAASALPGALAFFAITWIGFFATIGAIFLCSVIIAPRQWLVLSPVELLFQVPGLVAAPFIAVYLTKSSTGRRRMHSDRGGNTASLNWPGFRRLLHSVFEHRGCSALPAVVVIKIRRLARITARARTRS